MQLSCFCLIINFIFSCSFFLPWDYNNASSLAEEYPLYAMYFVVLNKSWIIGIYRGERNRSGK